jgi:hypothetical protein
MAHRSLSFAFFSVRSVCVMGAVMGGVVVLAACSAGGTDRTPFTEDASATPAQTPEQNATPAKSPQMGPSTNTTDPDASVAPDAPDTCVRTAPSKKCGVVPQCGCTLAETCDVEDSSGNVGCVTAGKAPMGAPCLATAGCGVGLTCVFGTCHSFCGNAGTACTAPKTGGCIQVNATGGVAIPNLTVCRVACDLRDVNGCGGTTAAGTGVCMVDSKGNTDCAMGGTHTAGQACTPTDDCGPGLVCTTTGSATTGTCRKWCRVGTNDCGGTTACSGFGTKVIVKGVEHGACP